MQSHLRNIYAPLPVTKRGSPLHVGTDPKGENLVYATGSCVVIRSLQEPTKADIYYEHSHQTTVAKYAPSGFYICSGDVAGNVRIWDTTQLEHPLKIELRVLSGEVRDIAWSFDSQRILVVGDGKEKFGAVFMWDAGSSVGEISGHTKPINSGDFKPSRPFRVATGAEDCVVAWFEGVPFKFKKSIKDNTRFVNCLRFAPDGSRFATASSDKKVIIYDGKTGEKQSELAAVHKMSIWSLAWSPDSQSILTASGDGHARIFDASSGQCKTEINFGSGTSNQQMSAIWMGPFIATVNLDGEISLLDPSGSVSRVINGHNKFITAMVPGNGRVYTADYSAKIVEWDVNTAETRPFKGKGHTNQISQMVIQGTNLISSAMDDTVRITSLTSMEYSTSISVDSPVVGIAAASNSDVIIIATMKSLYATRAGNISSSIEVPWGPTCVTISPDGTEVLVGGKDDKAVHVYSCNGSSLKQEKVLPACRGALSCVAYSPDGTHFATADISRNIYIWESRSKTIKIEGWIFHNARVNSLAWANDSHRLVSGSLDGTIIVWDIQNTSNRVHIKNAHISGVNVVSFLDGNSLVSVGQDCAMKTWNL